MRLIDADELNEEITNFFMAITGNPKPVTVVRECKKSFGQMLDVQPTAYYPDKVIDQLKEEGIIEDDYKGHRAIEIIQRGGYEDVPWQQEE